MRRKLELSHTVCSAVSGTLHSTAIALLWMYCTFYIVIGGGLPTLCIQCTLPFTVVGSIVNQKHVVKGLSMLVSRAQNLQASIWNFHSYQTLSRITSILDIYIHYDGPDTAAAFSQGVPEHPHKPLPCIVKVTLFGFC